jgi:hypothetical protein
MKLPSPEGWIETTREMVDAHWGDIDPMDVVDPNRVKKWKASDYEKNRFFFVAAIGLSQKGYLDKLNEASTKAVNRTRYKCDPILLPNSFVLKNKFVENVESVGLGMRNLAFNFVGNFFQANGEDITNSKGMEAPAAKRRKKDGETAETISTRMTFPLSLEEHEKFKTQTETVRRLHPVANTSDGLFHVAKNIGDYREWRGKVEESGLLQYGEKQQDDLFGVLHTICNAFRHMRETALPEKEDSDGGWHAAERAKEKAEKAEKMDNFRRWLLGYVGGKGTGRY